MQTASKNTETLSLSYVNAFVQPYPRRSSLASSRCAPHHSITLSNDPRPKRRMSSVKFAIKDDIKEIPKYDPAMVGDLFYTHMDFIQFRIEERQRKREKTRKRAELIMQRRKEACVTPTRKKTNFQQGQCQQDDIERNDLPMQSITFTAVSSNTRTQSNLRAKKPSQLLRKSYTFTEGSGFDIPLDQIRSHCSQNPSFVGHNLVRISLRCPSVPAAQSAKSA